MDDGYIWALGLLDGAFTAFAFCIDTSLTYLDFNLIRSTY